jgi:hypothetical protein
MKKNEKELLGERKMALGKWIFDDEFMYKDEFLNPEWLLKSLTNKILW